MRSNDSGHETMDNYSSTQYKADTDCIDSSSESGAAELRKKGSNSSRSSSYKNIKYLPRPMTVGGIPSTLPTPEYINLATDSHLYHTNDSEKHLNSSNSSADMKPTKGRLTCSSLVRYTIFFYFSVATNA